MNKEIELKAVVSEPEKIRVGLEKRYGKGTEIAKDDIYYLYPSGQLVRLRREDGRNCITLKRKTVAGGIEVNDELEFHVDDGAGFLSFCGLTGASEYVSKIKTGFRFETAGGVVIELCEVSSLGWFIEIEMVINPEEGTAGIDEAKESIMSVLKDLEIPEDRIEARSYSELLLEKKDG